jgi:nucleotide-binding universal stress UspA family protein
MFNKILVGYEGSDACTRAFAVALDLAKRYGSELHVCSVIEDLPRYAEETISEVTDLMSHAHKHYYVLHEELEKRATHDGVTFRRHVIAGHVVEALIHLASQENVDCLILGGVGRSKILHRAAGGTGTRIAYHAPCSVLIVR